MPEVEDQSHTIRSIYSRLDRTEAAIANITTDVASLVMATSNQNKSIENLMSEVQHLASRTNEVQRTNWSNIIGAIVVAIAVASGFFAYQNQSQEALASLFNERDTTIRAQATMRHELQDVQIKQLREDAGRWRSELDHLVDRYQSHQPEVATETAELKQRLLSLERDVYSGTTYRNGVPEKSGK